MKSFLRDATERQGQDERIRQWVSDVREVAQDAEDAIEMFSLKVDTCRGALERYACFPVHISHLNRVGEEILSIRTRLTEIKERRDTYGIGILGDQAEMVSKKQEMIEWRRRMAVQYQKDRDVVGLNEDAEFLLKHVILDEEKEGLSLGAIVGMGGIGKSTLARKIYNSPAIAARFEQRVWVVVSNEFAGEEIMKQIMQQLPITLDAVQLKAVEDIPDGLRRQEMRRKMLEEMRGRYMDMLKEVETMKERLRRQEMLQNMLRQRLEGKRYFIVLDDVWEQTHWQALKSAFPDEQGKGSRLLVTSRNEIMRKHEGYIHRMRLLNPDDSWELLLKKAFMGRSDGRCSPELEAIGRQILNKCRGLPLAITVAGGLLMQEGESQGGWEKVMKQVKEYQSETSEIGSNVSAILELSYHNLPSQLKPCFLCLAFFKEDAIIRTKRLVHMWVALGFVEVGEESAEEMAGGYLDELMKRNLVIVKDMTIDDRVKYFYVHDLIRELSIKKANEEIGFEQRSSISQSSSHKPRHLVVQRWIENNLCDENKHVRSLFLHVDDDCLIHRSYWKSFQLLRILDIEGSRLAKLPSTMRAMIGIRYLRLREEGTLVVPRWLDALRKLEVVDIADCLYAQFPDVPWKLQSVRHFYIRGSCILSGSTRISTWKNLETLKYITPCNFIQGISAGVRKLGVELNSGSFKTAKRWNRVDGRVRKLVEEQHCVWRESDDFINNWLKNEIWTLLYNSNSVIEAVHMKWDEERYAPSLRLDYYGLKRLTKLKINGPMKEFARSYEVPESNITHLTLSRTRIKNGDIMMNEVGELPKLLFLKLDDALRATARKQIRLITVNYKIDLTMKVEKNKFPRLKVLHLANMFDLKTIEIEQDGMPELQRLQIYNCPNLNLQTMRETITIIHS